MKTLKTLFFTAVITSLITFSVNSYAQGVIIYKNDGSQTYIHYTMLDSIVTYDNPLDTGFVSEVDQYGITIGHEVDLGLSVNWAGWDLGATSMRGYGAHFAWGELNPRTSNFRSGAYEYYGTNIGYNISGTVYDAARHILGDEWRMPTKAEAEELINECSWELITCGTIVGYKVTGPNGNSIFLPCSGCYLDDTLSNVNEHICYWIGELNCDEYKPNSYYYSQAQMLVSINEFRIGSDSRRTGHAIRPVKSK